MDYRFLDLVEFFIRAILAFVVAATLIAAPIVGIVLAVDILT